MALPLNYTGNIYSLMAAGGGGGTDMVDPVEEERRKQLAKTDATRGAMLGEMGRRDDAESSALESMGSSDRRKSFDEQSLAFDIANNSDPNHHREFKQSMMDQRKLDALRSLDGNHAARQDAFNNTRIGSAGNPEIMPGLPPPNRGMGGQNIGGANVQSTVPGTGYIDFGGSRTALVGGKQIDVPNGYVPNRADVYKLIEGERNLPVDQRETMPYIGAPSYDELQRPTNPRRDTPMDIQSVYDVLDRAQGIGEQGPMAPDPQMDSFAETKRAELGRALPVAQNIQDNSIYGILGKHWADAMRERGIQQRFDESAKQRDAKLRADLVRAAETPGLAVKAKAAMDAMDQADFFEQRGDPENVSKAASYRKRAEALIGEVDAAKSNIIGAAGGGGIDPKLNAGTRETRINSLMKASGKTRAEVEAALAQAGE